MLLSLLSLVACKTTPPALADAPVVPTQPPPAQPPPAQPPSEPAQKIQLPKEVMEQLQSVEIGERSAWVHIPDAMPEGKKIPLVLMFHGGHTSGLAVVNLWKEHFDKGFIIAFPNGQKTDPSFSGWYPTSGDVGEHVPFIHALIDDLSSKYPIDSKQIFAAGFSDGAQMTMRLACLSDRFSGYAMVAGALLENTRDACKPTHPAPMLLVFGTADEKTPKDGLGPGRQGSARLGPEATIDYWLAVNGCNKTSAISRSLPDLTEDGTTARERLFTECTHAPIRAIEIDGGGHFWPKKGTPPTPGRCTDFSATEEIMNLWFAAGGPNR